MRFRCSNCCCCALVSPPVFLTLFLYFAGYFIYIEPSALPDLMCRWLNDPHMPVNQTSKHHEYMQLARQRLTAKYHFCPTFRVATELIRSQILSDIIVTPMGDLPHTLVSIIERHTAAVRPLLHLQFAENIDEMKPYIATANPNDPCEILTIGVGGDIGAEERMKLKMPNCKFTGVDPSGKFGLIYKKIGRYFEVAIASSESNKMSLVMTDKFRYYERSSFKHMGLANFLKNYAKLPLVDLLLLDAEGAEYDLFTTFVRGGKLDQEGLVICQLSLELHGPLYTYANKMDNRQWTPLVTEFLLNTDFLPVWAYKVWPRHQILLFNTANEQCVRKFFPTFCGNK